MLIIDSKEADSIDKLLKKYMTGCCVSCSGSHGGYTHGSHGHHH